MPLEEASFSSSNRSRRIHRSAVSSAVAAKDFITLPWRFADIDSALEHLRSEGADLIDDEPRLGGRGARIAFLHPRAFAGTLVELVELPK